MFVKRNIALIILAFVANTLLAGNLRFQENKGQWQNFILFRANLANSSAMYLEKNAITFNMLSAADMRKMDSLHDGELKNIAQNQFVIHGHAFRMNFIGENPQVRIEPENMTTDYVNYYIGNNPKKWANHVKQYKIIVYHNLYSGIDLKLFSTKNYVKYDYILAPFADASRINWKYKGLDDLSIEYGQLILKTSIGNVVELHPFAFQYKNGQQIPVVCNFKLKNGVVGFDFPKGYDKSLQLIIDPQIIFSTYTGSTSDNWGYTATYDKEGDAYAGGICFGTGYPITTGAYQINYGGGQPGQFLAGFDVVISKFNPIGTNLIYSTYLGGSGNESPHSLVVDSNDNLIVYGTTSSADFPVTTTAYDTTFNSTTPYFSKDYLNYATGVDIYVTKFNAAGSNLIGSTFIGGSGVNGIVKKTTGLFFNYGDEFRGEVIVDPLGNITVASTSTSTNFPTTANAPQTASPGGQNGVVFQFDSTLNNLNWSTYLGGDSDDAAYGIAENTTGDFYVCGGTASTDFPVTSNGLETTEHGGVDGFVVKLNYTGTSILSGTYLGTSGYDQCYLIQTDLNDKVYVLGQSNGNYPVSSTSLYSNPNSGQFVHKLTPNLDTTLFSTTIGTSSGYIDISPTAFLVDNCNHIYISGWGGQVNRNNSNALHSTTTGLPITPGAYQTTTTGSNFYLAILDDSAKTLMYATYFGGNGSMEHVDGGTSRFDKRGYVYQAACAGCGGTSQFATTPGVWSNTNNSSNCNLAVFKFDLSSAFSNIGSGVPPKACVNTTINFTDSSTTGTNFYWDFGDGGSSTLFAPSHIFQDTGTFTIRLFVSDSLFCSPPDIDSVHIQIVPYPTVAVSNDTIICPGDTIQVFAYSPDSVYWIPNSGIVNPNVDSPFVYTDTDKIYKAIAHNYCGTDTAALTVFTFKDSTNIISDQAICLGDSIQLWASGGNNYTWSPPTGLSDTNISKPMASPSITTIYQVAVTDANTCVWQKTMTLFVDTNLPHAVISPKDTLICLGDTAHLIGSGGHFLEWTPSNLVDSSTASNVEVFPTSNTNFILKATNGCGIDYDTALVRIEKVIPKVSNDTNICIKNNIIFLHASGGVDYLWTPSQYILSGADSDSVRVQVLHPTTFMVKITDTLGCYAYDSVFVDTTVVPWFEVGLGGIVEYWEKIQLHAYTTLPGTIQWSPASSLSCANCFNPTANPQVTTNYLVTFTDTNGCQISDTVNVIVRGGLYVPNTFTPDGDGLNDMFFAYSYEIQTFTMRIFNRWGQLIFTSNDLNKGWDGYYDGNMCQVGVYVWKITYTDKAGTSKTMIGNVNLVR